MGSYSSFRYSIATAPTGPLSLDAVRTMLDETAAAGRTFPSLASTVRAMLGVAGGLGGAANDDGHRSAQPVEYSINVTNTVWRKRCCTAFSFLCLS